MKKRIGKNFFLNISPVEEVLISLLRGDNNVVITTKCNLNCVFCSRKFNPFTTECSHKEFNFIKAQINLLKPNRQVLVNNAISRLTDGEPFTHPRIWDILNLIREKFPYKHSTKPDDKIQITTNGTFLTKDNLKRLDDLKGMIIIHSIQTTDEKKWAGLTGATHKLAKIVTNIPNSIKDYNITYIPSIVALPEIVGWDDIEKTIRDLNNEDASAIRMFLPTYTKYSSKQNQDMLKCDKEKLLALVLKLRKELKTKILCYPFYPEDVTPHLIGYEHYGIMPTDTILSINKEKVFSSYHAQKLLVYNKNETCTINLEGGGMTKTISIKPQDINIMSYTNMRVNEDVYFLPKTITRAVKDYNKVLVLTSEAGASVVRGAFEKAVGWEPVLRGKEFFFRGVRSRFYGGSVVCAGLLMCSDYGSAVEEFLSSGNVKPDIILVSSKSFDPLGRDLLKKSVYDLSDKLNIPIKKV